MRLVLPLTIIAFFVILQTNIVQGQLVSDQTYTTGIITGFADSYLGNSKASLQVEDKDMVGNPDEISLLHVHVWSYADATGIWIALTETAPGSGVFQGAVYFSTTLQSGGSILHVSPGNKVTAEYTDTISNIGKPVALDMFTHIIGIAQPPSSPLGLTAVPSSIDITLTWSPPSNDGGSTITGYKIERDDGSGYQTIAQNTNSEATTYHDAGVVAGSSYKYRVSAINSAGTGSPSNEASISLIPNFDFQVSVNPETAEMKPGSSVTYSVSIITVSGTPQPVSLSCSFQVPSERCEINPSVLAPNNSSTLTVTSDQNAQNGKYTGSIMASSNGLIHNVEFFAVVTPLTLPPVAKITPPESTQIQENMPVQFSAADSYAVSGFITSYAWDFGDGQKGEGTAVTHTYQSSGTYTVGLTVTDSNGMQSKDTVYMTANVPSQTSIPPWAAPVIGGSAAAGAAAYGIKIWKTPKPNGKKIIHPHTFSPYPRLEVEGGIDE